MSKRQSQCVWLFVSRLHRSLLLSFQTDASAGFAFDCNKMKRHQPNQRQQQQPKTDQAGNLKRAVNAIRFMTQEAEEGQSEEANKKFKDSAHERQFKRFSLNSKAARAVLDRKQLRKTKRQEKKQGKQRYFEERSGGKNVEEDSTAASSSVSVCLCLCLCVRGVFVFVCLCDYVCSLLRNQSISVIQSVYFHHATLTHTHIHRAHGSTSEQKKKKMKN
jgi:hypothetical protein